MNWETAVKIDIPYLKAMTNARLENLSYSRTLLAEGKVDNFSKSDVAAGLAKPGEPDADE